MHVEPPWQAGRKRINGRVEKPLPKALKAKDPRPKLDRFRHVLLEFWLRIQLESLKHNAAVRIEEKTDEKQMNIFGSLESSRCIT